MSKPISNIPKADILMGSMRSMGYSFESAVADIVDNSISAGASLIKILFPKDPLDPEAVGILDNGIGMSNDELYEAMRYGSSSAEKERDENDLGRFGLGMKSASLSQCKQLTVVSVKDGKVCGYSWDFNYICSHKEWLVLQLSEDEIANLPYYSELCAFSSGTIVIWRDFDVLSKSSDGQVYDALQDLKDVVATNLSLIFHRYLDSTTRKLSIYVNNFALKANDPFLEHNRKTTTKKTRTIAITDSTGVERQIVVKPYILPFATDLTEKDKKMIGGVANLRSKQGFYIYRNMRLIIWGTWFGMKQRAELTKNARVRVDIPNTLDDIWHIDIKKQKASIPKRIQNQLKETVMTALEISIHKEKHRGRKEKADDDIDYIWDRMEGRNNTYFYQINRDSKLFQYVRSKLSEEDFTYFDLLLTEIEKNIPVQQIYLDQCDDAIEKEEPDGRLDDIYQKAITLVDYLLPLQKQSPKDIIENLMKSEPFCKYPTLKNKILQNYEH